MILLAKIALGAAGTAVVAGALAFSEGAITVHVREHRPNGQNIQLYLPAAAVPLAMRLVPQQHFGRVPEEARQVLPAVRQAVRHAATLPDFTLVEVESPREHVRIEKRGRRLVIHVQEQHEEVYVAVPLRTIARVLREVERAGPAQ